MRSAAQVSLLRQQADVRKLAAETTDAFMKRMGDERASAEKALALLRERQRCVSARTRVALPARR